MLLLRARVDLGAMAMKGYSAFLKAPPLLEPLRLFNVISGHSFVWRSYASSEMQSVYSTAPADWATGHLLVESYLSTRIRVDLRVIAMKRLSTFPKVPGLEPHHRMHFSVLARTLVGGWSYPSTQM